MEALVSQGYSLIASREVQAEVSSLDAIKERRNAPCTHLAKLMAGAEKTKD